MLDIGFEFDRIPIKETTMYVIDTISVFDTWYIEAFVQCQHKKQGNGRGWRAKHVRHARMIHAENFDVSMYQNFGFDIGH